MTPEIRDFEGQPAVVHRAVTDAAGMRRTIDEGFGALFGRLAAAGAAPAGPPYLRYLGVGEQLEVELGVPVAAGGALEGLEVGGLPAGRVAFVRHVGPYEQLREVCERLGRWAEAEGETPAAPPWEVYVTNPVEEPDPAKRITDVYIPLR